MTHPVLYSFRRCPYAMRARMALYYAGINAEVREVDLKNKPQALLEISPKGTVPVLHLPDGTVIDESLDILNWAVKQNDPKGWARVSDDVFDKYHKDMTKTFIPNLNRYKYPVRYEDADPDLSRQICEEYLAQMNATMVKNSGYLGEQFMSKSDILVFPFIRQYRIVDNDAFDRLPLPALHRWFSEFYRSDLFNDVMIKRDPWEDGDKPGFLIPRKDELPD
tara:strand:- start:1056 stop:1718 length:663 start_codon:yes stop_codon:yes gene_type:complete